jgi:very-short-patch-repair endonuclease
VIQCAAIDARKLALARRFRREPTPAEADAWQLLRGRRLLGLKFRRQTVIAGFIDDFYCASLRLVLELDGAIHDDPVQAEYDAIRTQILSMLAIDVLRIRDDQISERALRELLAPYSEPPSPARESRCISRQAFPAPSVSNGGLQGRPSRTMAFSIVRSLRMQATRATFTSLPRPTSRL